MSVRNWAADLLTSTARLLRRTGTALTAIAAGLSDERHIIRRNQRYWDYRDFWMARSHVFSGLMKWEEQVYDAHLPSTGTVGVIGCGAGRDLVALTRRGLRTIGVDLSPCAVEWAGRYLAEAGIDARVHCADVSKFEFPDPPYDAFIFSYSTYSYIPGAKRRIQILSNLERKLAPNGCIIASFLKANGVPEGRASQLTRWVAHLTGNRRPHEPGDHFGPDLNSTHLFTQEEITREAHAAQMEVIYFDVEEKGIAVLKKKIQPKTR